MHRIVKLLHLNFLPFPLNQHFLQTKYWQNNKAIYGSQREPESKRNMLKIKRKVYNGQTWNEESSENQYKISFILVIAFSQ